MAENVLSWKYNLFRMRSLALVAFICLILSSAVFSQSASSREIPFQLLESGHIRVKATIDGIEGNFIFDTGAGLIVFTKQFFDKLPHHERQDGGYTAFRATGERLDVDLYNVRNLEFGSLKYPGAEVSYLDFNLGGLDGILSLKLLETQPFTIDFDHKVIRLETPAGLAALRKTRSRIPIQPEDSRGRALDIFAYFRVNDTLTLQLSLDSGAGKDVYKFNAKYMQALGIDANDTLHVKKRTRKSEINPAFTSATYIASVNKIASAAVPSVSTTGLRAQFVEGLIYDGIMWINWLGSAITVDIPGRMLLVKQ